jgi:preprotein translocase subunit SecE
MCVSFPTRAELRQSFVVVFETSQFRKTDSMTDTL